MQNLAVVVKQDNVQKRFADILGKNAPAFISSVLTTVNNNSSLQKCDPMSILSAAINAATLRLAVNPNLGQAYLIPFGNQCQFQIGWKGLIQLAQRSKRYKSITADSVYEGEIISFNKFTEEVVFGERKSDKLIGFFARFELVDGFSKSVFWSTERMEQHALKYSKSYKLDKQSGKKNSGWSSDFEAMGRKTIIKRLLSHFGPLNIDDNVITSEIAGDISSIDAEPADFDVPFDEVFQPSLEAQS